MDLKDFVAGFLLEADEHLHSINRNLVATSEALGQKRAAPRAIRELFRSFHTIKGLASMVGAEPIVELTHEMEGILRASDRAGGRIPESSLDLLLEATRAVEERVQAISRDGIGRIPPAPAALVEALAHAQDAPAETVTGPSFVIDLPEGVLKSLSPADREQIIQAAQAPGRVVLVEFRPSPARAAAGFNITSVRDGLGKLGALIKVAPYSAPDAPTGISFGLVLATLAGDVTIRGALGDDEAPVRAVVATVAPAPVSDDEAPAFESVSGDEWASTDHTSIRVDVRRLDEALERLSALVVTRSKLARVAAEMGASGVDVRELNVVISENTRQLRRLRAAITEARMVSLDELLQRLPLVARGLAKGTGKSVAVEIQAGSTEVDKAVADKVFPAVVHLIRNAVDHAIETREDRARAGKPETGVIRIVCDGTSGTSLVLTMTDDGRGIDRQAVAARLGRPIAGSDEELLLQIATPGLSTRDDVTRTSGRGMGMDIVKRTIEMIGGALSLRTVEGHGSTFILRVPVSVTIVDVLSFVAGGQPYVVPVAMIDEIVEARPEDLVDVPMPARAGADSRLLRRRDRAIPYFGLDAVLKRRTDAADERVARKALIVIQGEGAVAFGVDRLLGQQEVVVRPLDDLLVRAPGLAGATDLGDGRPTLVLDLATLAVAVSKTGAMPVAPPVSTPKGTP